MRSPPQRVLGLPGGGLDVLEQIVAIGEQGRQVRAERDPRGSGQSREVEDQLGLVLRGPGQRVGEDQSPFGIGVVDLDLQAETRLDDVAGAQRRGGNRILDRRDQEVKADRQPLGGDE